MALSGLHLLLTYQCTSECDHCFVWGSPWARATMPLSMIQEILDQADELGTVRSVFFEGGEPFLYYSTLLEGIRLATARGHWTGIVSNAFWATSRQDAFRALSRLVQAGLQGIQLSADRLHSPLKNDPRPRFAAEAAKELGIYQGIIAVEKPATEARPSEVQRKGEPIQGGDICFKGRAAELLTEGLIRIPWESLDLCPYEELVSPRRAHIDPYGNVHICQGLLMGNLRKTPLSELAASYCADEHPIAGQLVSGGPAKLAKTFDLPMEEGYVDACHLCYRARSRLRARYPNYLGPAWVYGEQASRSRRRPAGLARGKTGDAGKLIPGPWTSESSGR